MRKCADVAGSQNFTKEERTQKYGMGQGKKEPCGDELDVKTLV